MKREEKEQYLKRGTLAVLNVLRDIEREGVPVMVNYSRGQFISRLLFADSDQLIIDHSSQQQDNQWVTTSDSIHISAETRGAKIEFALPALNTMHYDGLPAFSSPLPELLWAIQRREFFRVSAPLNPVYWCTCTWPNGEVCRLRLQDISLGGIGTLCDEAIPVELTTGMIFRKLQMDLGELGLFELDAELVHLGQHSVIGSKNETRTTPRLSFRYHGLNNAQERQLQQAIFSLEREARDKERRFQ
ncbi:flagellar brake protein [Enterobacterales bacterium CwR94]|nr:flagellar brake protein [Enterobacterales bacterium CwR94]